MMKGRLFRLIVLFCLLLAIVSCVKKTTEIQYITPTDMIHVQGGTFNNGSSNVTISSFFLEKYEVTQVNYQSVMGVNPSYFTGVIKGPVEEISWFNAIEYCNRRSIAEDLLPCYTYSTFGTNPDEWPMGWNSNSFNHSNITCSWTAEGYRLPTEMEWLFAARGGIKSHDYTYSGSDYINAVAWYYGNSSYSTHMISTKACNELGLYDMSGNVWEWVWDIYAESFPDSDQDNPHGPVSGTQGLIRGGCYASSTDQCALTNRIVMSFAEHADGMGFRVCRISL